MEEDEDINITHLTVSTGTDGGGDILYAADSINNIWFLHVNNSHQGWHLLPPVPSTG